MKPTKEAFVLVLGCEEVNKVTLGEILKVDSCLLMALVLVDVKGRIVLKLPKLIKVTKRFLINVLNLHMGILFISLIYLFLLFAIRGIHHLIDHHLAVEESILGLFKRAIEVAELRHVFALL